MEARAKTAGGWFDWPGRRIECRIGQSRGRFGRPQLGALAQLVARFHGMEEVRGSSPLSSTAKVLVKAHLILRNA